jgi:hypothetical protein
VALAGAGVASKQQQQQQQQPLRSLAGMPAILPDCPGLQEKDEYVENIIADIHRLGLRFEKITYTSDYFPQLKECGERMIKAGERMCDTVGAGRLAVGGLFCVKECGERMIEAGACGRAGKDARGAGV